MTTEIDELRAQVDERESLLTQSDKLASLGQLAAGMVHEINNPLTSILAYTDFFVEACGCARGRGGRGATAAHQRVGASHAAALA